MKDKAFTINKLSELTGLDRRTIKRRLAHAKPDAKGRYFAADALPLLKSVPAELEEKRRFECRKLAAQCERFEFENKVRMGQFIPEEEVKRVCVRAVHAAKARLLAIPPALCQKLALLDDPIAIEQELRQPIHDALRELSRGEWFKEEFTCPHCQRQVLEFITDGLRGANANETTTKCV